MFQTHWHVWLQSIFDAAWMVPLMRFVSALGYEWAYVLLIVVAGSVHALAAERAPLRRRRPSRYFTSNSPTSTVSAWSFRRSVTVWSRCWRVPQWVLRRRLKVVAPVTSCSRLPKKLASTL